VRLAVVSLALATATLLVAVEAASDEQWPAAADRSMQTAQHGSPDQPGRPEVRRSGAASGLLLVTVVVLAASVVTSVRSRIRPPAAPASVDRMSDPLRYPRTSLRDREPERRVGTSRRSGS
jgi:hypothetical protein